MRVQCNVTKPMKQWSSVFLRHRSPWFACEFHPTTRKEILCVYSRDMSKLNWGKVGFGELWALGLNFFLLFKVLYWCFSVSATLDFLYLWCKGLQCLHWLFVTLCDSKLGVIKFNGSGMSFLCSNAKASSFPWTKVAYCWRRSNLSLTPSLNSRNCKIIHLHNGSIKDQYWWVSANTVHWIHGRGHNCLKIAMLSVCVWKRNMATMSVLSVL